MNGSIVEITALVTLLLDAVKKLDPTAEVIYQSYGKSVCGLFATNELETTRGNSFSFITSGFFLYMKVMQTAKTIAKNTDTTPAPSIHESMKIPRLFLTW